MSDGRITIPVKFEDRDLFFLIDTGGVFSTVEPEVVSSLKLNTHQSNMPLFGIGGRKLSQQVDPENFAIGRLKGKGFSFYVEPRGLRTFDGTLAPQILGAYDLDIDFAAGTFRLFSQDHCPGQVIYWTQTGPWAIVPITFDKGNGHISIPVSIDGKSIKAVIDTGAVRSVMNLSTARRFLDFDERNPETTAMGVGPQKSYRFPFKTLSFEGVAVAHPDIEILPNNVAAIAGRDLILGIDVLRQLHVYIAYKEEKMYLTSASAH